MGSDNFKLQWDDFESNVRLSYKELRYEEDFCDVTIITDSKEFKAHKVVLSSGSLFFKNILKRTLNHANPIIYLKGLEDSEIISVLDFIYYGEVSVCQDKIETFIQTAKELQIKGLIDKPEQQKTKEGKRKESFSTSSGSSSKKFKEEDEEEYQIPQIILNENFSGYEGEEEEDGEIHEIQDFENTIPEYINFFAEEKYDCAITNIKEYKMSLMIEKLSGGRGRCKVCNQNYSAIRSVRRHIYASHWPTELKCQSCRKGFGTKEEIERHILCNHNSIPSHFMNIDDYNH